MPWSTKFEDPIPGIISLRDAANHIQKLPKPEQELPHWQTAIEALMMAAEGTAPLMHARIGMLRAMNHGRPVERVGRRKRVKAYRIAATPTIEPPKLKP